MSLKEISCKIEIKWSLEGLITLIQINYWIQRGSLGLIMKKNKLRKRNIKVYQKMTWLNQKGLFMNNKMKQSSLKKHHSPKKWIILEIMDIKIGKEITNNFLNKISYSIKTFKKTN